MNVCKQLCVMADGSRNVDWKLYVHVVNVLLLIELLTNLVLQSGPFDLKKEPVLLPGISQEE